MTTPAGDHVTQTEPGRIPPGVDPNDSPWECPPVEGLPFPRGGEEDQAIRRILGLPPWESPFWRRWGTSLARRVARALGLGRSASA